jgi:hypothetical protein
VESWVQLTQGAGVLLGAPSAIVGDFKVSWVQSSHGFPHGGVLVVVGAASTFICRVDGADFGVMGNEVLVGIGKSSMGIVTFIGVGSALHSSHGMSVGADFSWQGMASY